MSEFPLNPEQVSPVNPETPEVRPDGLSDEEWEALQECRHRAKGRAEAKTSKVSRRSLILRGLGFAGGAALGGFGVKFIADHGRSDGPEAVPPQPRTTPTVEASSSTTSPSTDPETGSAIQETLLTQTTPFEAMQQMGDDEFLKLSPGDRAAYTILSLEKYGNFSAGVGLKNPGKNIFTTEMEGLTSGDLIANVWTQTMHAALHQPPEEAVKIGTGMAYYIYQSDGKTLYPGAKEDAQSFYDNANPSLPPGNSLVAVSETPWHTGQDDFGKTAMVKDLDVEDRYTNGKVVPGKMEAIMTRVKLADGRTVYFPMRGFVKK